MIKHVDRTNPEQGKGWPDPSDDKAERKDQALPPPQDPTRAKRELEQLQGHQFRKMSRARKLYQERQTQRLFQQKQKNKTGKGKGSKRSKDSGRKIFISINGVIRPYSPEQFSEHTKRHGIEVQYLPELIFADEKLLDSFQPTEAQGPQVHSDFQPPVYLDFIDEEIGWGVFARRDIAPGEIIGEYTGVVTLMGSGNAYTMFYSPRYEKHVIDATFFGNETRYINHSEDPNCEFDFTRSADGIDHRLFMATREIREGDQVLTNYGSRYWEGLQPRKL